MSPAAELPGAELAGGRPARRLPRLSLLALVCLATPGYLALSGWSASHAFLINATESLPNWAFLVEKEKAPRRGDYAFFRVPRTPLITAHFGADPKPFGKRVVGMPGDLVTRAGNVVSVNGRAVARTKPLTRRGEVLVPGPVGRVPNDCYFMATPHPDGFDSRYADVGFICRDRMIGTGVPVL